jgi:isopentenyl-diphosphate delta-isomerase
MSDQTNDRKIEHIRAIENDPKTDRDGRFFDQIQLCHRGLPELALDQIDPSVEFLGKKLSFPLLISSMTGGDHALIKTINRNLAEAAERTGVALAVGSQRVMFTQPAARDSFDLRTYAPNTVLLGNIGAVQLNYGFSLEQCQQAVDLLQADGLYLHLNPLQEAVQPEGDTDFFGLQEKIAAVTEKLSISGRSKMTPRPIVTDDFLIRSSYVIGDCLSWRWIRLTPRLSFWAKSSAFRC